MENLQYIRHDIKPGYGRIGYTHVIDNIYEVIFGCAEKKADHLGDEMNDNATPVFSIVVRDPETAKVYSKVFDQLAKEMEK